MHTLLQNQMELPIRSFDTPHLSEESINEILRLKVLENRRIKQINVIKRMLHDARHQDH